MNYIHLATAEFPVTERQIRTRNLNVSFPDPFEPTSDYAPVEPTPLPAFDAATSKLVLSASFDAETETWVEAWSVVALTQEELEDKTADEASTLLSLKAQRSAFIDAEWSKADQSVFMHQDKEFACDLASRSRIDAINGYVSLTGSLPSVGWVGGWKSNDNSLLPITTKEEWVAFYSAMIQAGIQNFVKAQTLKAQISAATDTDSVIAISW
jgi:hypothetical protein